MCLNYLVQFDKFESALLSKHELVRPGYSRLSLHYAISDAELEYILEAVHFVANYG